MKRSTILTAILICITCVFAADSASMPTGAAMKPVTRKADPPPTPIFKARDFGAKGDGTTDDTAALRKAIATCAGTGGSVLLDNGTFISGNLELKGNMTLYIAEGAVLQASSKPEDFPVIQPRESSGTAAWGSCHRSLLYACIPAHTFFIRHADLVHLENVHAGTAAPDVRPWLRSTNAKVETVNCRDLGVVKP